MNNKKNKYLSDKLYKIAELLKKLNEEVHKLSKLLT